MYLEIMVIFKIKKINFKDLKINLREREREIRVAYYFREFQTKEKCVDYNNEDAQRCMLKWYIYKLYGLKNRLFVYLFFILEEGWPGRVFMRSDPLQYLTRWMSQAFKTPHSSQHPIGDKRQIQRFLQQGSSPPTETAAHSSIFLQWLWGPLRAPGWTHVTCQDISVPLTAVTPIVVYLNS